MTHRGAARGEQPSAKVHGHAHAASSPLSFSVSKTDGAARVGVLETAHGTVSTPLSLLHTKRGASLHLVPDMLRRLAPPPTAFQLDILHL
jgi:hypothetical protein